MNKTNIDTQTLDELEFTIMSNLLANHCKSDKAKSICKKLSPYGGLSELQDEFNLLAEIKAIYTDEISFPHPYFNDIKDALKLLNISNGVLTLDEILKIYKLCLGTKELVDFSKKYKQTYSQVYQACAHIERIDEVIRPVSSIINARMQIKDDATKRLQGIRQSLHTNRNTINRNFERLLRNYRKDEILGDIEEVFLEEKRLISVLSQHKKKVAGKVIDSSSGGTLTYIEPRENVELNQNQEKLRLDERNEIFQILKATTEALRAEKYYLEAYQRVLVRFDLLNAKVVFAKSYNGIVPKSDSGKWYWKDAIHPLLYLKNQENGIKTIGQEVELNEDQRFLVISGPNAGGKSITLKTVGLLQLMFQYAFLVPVNEVSEFKWFKHIGSDIGDNQSIENQLSTYSYRLQRMNMFLTESHENSLILLDEFGSGSDPELGGALAEVFYERLYAKNCFAVITTHYTNIKILTSTLPNAVNACMLFDTNKLEPLYLLSIGQPGSSFTFEVAKNNGIDESIIQEAKSKVSEGKIKIDELSVALQREKSKFKKVNASQYKSKANSDKLIRDYENKLLRLKEQAQKQAQYFEQQNKFLNTGKKIFELIKKYKHHKTNKALKESVTKLVAIEKTKVLQKEKPVEFKKNLKQPKLPEVKNKITAAPKPNEPSSTKKTDQSSEVKIPIKKPLKLKVGDTVKHLPSGNKGKVLGIKNNAIELMIGNFKVTTKLKDLEKAVG